MNNLVLSPIPLSEMENLIKVAVKNAFESLSIANKSPQPETDRPLTVKETAKFLDLAIPSVYGKIHKKELPFIKRGGRVYFVKSDLLQWLQQGKQKTADEIEKEAELHVLNQKNRRA